ncbi:hypothetical protein [Polyangium sp. 15x6]|uniref:hypothetical protein n=1 Tax=Polyangium sp. 15x6 TaxID=3042687 RepID=UPI002499F1BC|nr:hypothetical protein [Polyangium sp. 15x6]MDI3289930.1 hypothetical protein [Polyangium sp. 15x6]
MKIRGAMALSTSLALAGCMAQESDVPPGEPAGEAEQALDIATGDVICNSGWPGTRGCSARFGDGREILPGSIKVNVVGHNGAISWSAELVDNNRAINFTASIREGNAFGPGDNTTRFALAWITL